MFPLPGDGEGPEVCERYESVTKSRSLVTRKRRYWNHNNGIQRDNALRSLEQSEGELSV